MKLHVTVKRFFKVFFLKIFLSFFFKVIISGFLLYNLCTNVITNTNVQALRLKNTDFKLYLTQFIIQEFTRCKKTKEQKHLLLYGVYQVMHTFI